MRSWHHTAIITKTMQKNVSVYVLCFSFQVHGVCFQCNTWEMDLFLTHLSPTLGSEKNKGLIEWKRFIYGEINQPMELCFKGTKDSSGISMRKTVGLHFLHILKGFTCPSPTVKAQPHSRACPGCDHWNWSLLINNWSLITCMRPTSSSWNDSFGSITQPHNLNTYLKGLRKFRLELEECSSDKSCPGRGMKGLGGLGLHTFQFWESWQTLLDNSFYNSLLNWQVTPAELYFLLSLQHPPLHWSAENLKLLSALCTAEPLRVQALNKEAIR